MQNKLIRDGDQVKISVFTIADGKTLVSPYTPTIDEVVCLGADVTITINAVGVEYVSGSIVGLKAGIEYTLSASTPVHFM